MVFHDNLEGDLQSPAASLTLTDMLDKLPSMFEAMSSDAKRGLLTINRAFRKHVHETADVVTADWTDVLLLVSGDWRRLQSLSLSSSSGSSPSALSHYLWNNSEFRIYWAFPHSRLHWPSLTHLSLSGLQLNTPVLSQLQTELPHLKDLDLSNSQLTHVTLRQLVSEGSWPSLRRLDLSQNRFDRAFAPLLARGDWPSLQELILRSCTLRSMCVCALAQASWPALKLLHLGHNLLWSEAYVYDEPPSLPNWSQLENLYLTGGPQRPRVKRAEPYQPQCQVMFVAVVDAHLQHLKHLDLSGHGHRLRSDTMLCFSQGHWPSLVTLSLSSSLYRDEMHESFGHLIDASLPVLQDLALSGHSRPRGGLPWNEFITILVQGAWPHLKRLHLRRNYMSGAVLPILAQGDWPFLDTLDLRHNGLCRQDLVALALQASWPLMQNLNVTDNARDPRFAKLANDPLISSAWPLMIEQRGHALPA